MVFSSVTFLYLFLPIVLLLYFLAHGIPVKNLVFFAASVLFYAWGEPRAIFLVLFSVIVNWLLGRGIGAKPSRGKLFVVVGVVYNIGILFVFKYLNFFLDNLNAVLGWFGATAIEYTPIALPIGISFFTFQILSYVIDVYRGEVKPQRNVMYLGLYILMFPQLIAGPIVRYEQIENEIRTRRTTLAGFSAGTRRFMVGFCKKILLANSTGVLADYAFGLSERPFLLAWLGAIAYALQLYFDFSAYSDMAIGLGQMFGFHYLENFNYPYISKSIREFWRRWHISLSTWFRDYLYIPMGGSRGGTAKTYRNLLLVFFVTGLWHGASWNFVAWGLYHGAFLILERGRFGKLLDRAPKALGHLYSLVVVLFGWVLFRANTLTEALHYMRDMFTNPANGVLYSLSALNAEVIFFSLAALLFCVPLYPRFCAWKNNKKPRLPKLGSLALSTAHNLAILVCFAAGLLYMAGSNFNPFIYFRF